jgi:hypothetical protein
MRLNRVFKQITALKKYDCLRVGLEVSICLIMVWMETFGLDSSKNDISTVKKSRHLDKS